MASSDGVKVVDSGVQAALEKLRLGLPLGGRMKPTFEAMGRVLKTGAQLRFRTATGPDGKAWEKSWRAKTEGGQTLSLTRRLRNSLSYQATESSVAVGTNVVYAAIHQFGGVIRAKAGPFLSIPVTPAARAAGSPRNMTGLHVVQSVKGQFMLVNEKGVVQYLLKKQVTIPARPFLGMSDGDQKELLSIAEKHLQTTWKR